MSPYRIDYSQLVTALRENDREEAGKLLKELTPRLKMYLSVTRDAPPEDAEEAIQNAYIRVYEKVMNDEITNEKYFFRYLILACRREYARYLELEKRHLFETFTRTKGEASQPEQMRNLLDKDRQRVLKKCLHKLSEENREYITFILKHPDISTGGLSDHFEISEANVRVKKLRIIQKLNSCVKINMDK